MAAIYSNGGNRWNILGFNFTQRDALSSVYKISMDIRQIRPGQNSYIDLVMPLEIAFMNFSYAIMIFNIMSFGTSSLAGKARGKL